ncbi:COMM domain-containing protein 4-like [Thraustotheca clavata]|uniref:COMM domain-containing protein 4-like n=1 Tax=Thraustotheca clavata TaxID=74557 RepID=A0A1V9Y906_9STRA|nr:COMM domain-containing protein 4-like [Thraustotheca clavata]
MKFRFCGDQEPPAWLLAEIPVISMLVRSLFLLKSQNRTAALQQKLDEMDRKALVVSIKWIILHAAKYNVEAMVLATELPQLGLPADSAKAIATVYHDNQTSLRRYLAANNMKLGHRIKSVESEIEYVFGTRHAPTLKTANVELTFYHDKMLESTNLTMDIDTFRILHQELRQARKLMDLSLN